MSFTPKTANFDFLTTSAAAVLTNAVSKKIRITSISLHNIHTSPVVVIIWRAPNNGGNVRTVSADDRYQRVKTVVLAGNSNGVLADWILDAENDTIQMKADTASKVSGDITYIEEA